MAFHNLKSTIGSKIHFIGIGGIGMSALAFLLKKINVEAQGSDLSQNYITDRLKLQNIEVFQGHDAKNITSDISLIIKTSIIKDSNPEIVEAKNKNIKIITRAQLLAMVMQEKKSITIAGTHGKTSTTGILSAIIEEAGLDPIVINGGVINNYDSNFKLGNGDYIIAGSDESDGSFVDLPSFCGAVTNIEPEHLDFYDQDFEKQKSYFKRYIEQIQNQENGICALCVDSKEVKNMIQTLAGQNNIATYSVQEDSGADFTAINIELNNLGSKFDVKIAENNQIIKDVFIPAYGVHNVSNALASIIIANHLKIDENAIKNGLKSFSGVKRRFTKVGEFNGCAIIDDYAHHPTEVAALISSAKQFVGDKKVVLVLQPHKYTRVRDLFEEFCDCVSAADRVILCDIHTTGQEPIKGATKEDLFEGIQKIIGDRVILPENNDQIAKILKESIESGDLILCAGAGTITDLAKGLEKKLRFL